MKIETMLRAYKSALVNSERKQFYNIKTGKTPLMLIEKSVRTEIGIARRYNALQAENAALRSELAATEYLLSECVNGAQPVNDELSSLRDDNARLRNELNFVTTVRESQGRMIARLRKAHDGGRLFVKAVHDGSELLLDQALSRNSR